MAENQTNRCLKLVFGFYEPFIVVEDPKPPYKIRGAAFDLIKIIMDKLNYCYTLVRASDIDFGTKMPNGTWTGSMGLLHRGEVDMSAVIYVVSDQRATAVDFSTSAFSSEHTIGYMKPQVQSDLAGIIKPFTYNMWLSIFLSFLVTLAFSQFIFKGYKSIMHSSDDGMNSDSDSQSSGVFMWTFCALLMQSVPWMPKGDSVRLIAGIWLLAAFIVATVYRSSVMAMLIAPLQRLPFNSFEELATTDAQVYLTPGIRIADAVEEAEPGSSLWKAKKNFISAQDDFNSRIGVNGYFGLKWGIITSRISLEWALHYFFSAYGYCGHYIMSEGIFSSNMLSYGFPKKSSLKAKVDPLIDSLKESGIIARMLKQNTLNASECLKPIGSIVENQKRPLSIKDLASSFYIFTAGMVLSILTAGFECLTKKYSRSLELGNSS